MQGINWREWSEDSFREAKEANKPVLLAITAVWCHWCHVMDQTTYSDERVVNMANDLFIPVRVDNDRRPDVNARYNMGGWPSTVFLTPEADILTGATYLPPEQMVDLMHRVSSVFMTSREELQERAKDMRKQMAEQRQTLSEPATVLTEGLSARVLRGIIGSYDTRYGGFGAQQKFPHTDALDFLLLEYHLSGDSDLLGMVKKTLEAMDQGEIHDRISGGFFRYATQSNWSIPHYEKMLQDNASLMNTYVSAYQQVGDQRYLDVAFDITQYLKNTLYDGNIGAFYGSQDADERYYRLSAEERLHAEPPRVDKTIYTSWNAMAAYSFLRLYQATLDAQYRDIALRCIAFLVEKLKAGDKGFAHYYDGEAKEYGILNDQVEMLWTLIAAFESTGDNKYIAEAEGLAQVIWNQYHEEKNGLVDITDERMQSQKLAFRDKPLEDNALAARAFNRLSVIAHNYKWKRNAEVILRFVATMYEDFGMMAAPYATALVEVLDEPVRVNITGSKDASKTQELLESALQAREPLKIVQVLDRESLEAELGGVSSDMSNESKVYICHGTTCRAAIDTPGEVASAVTAAGGHPVDIDEIEE